jgi:exodeoxyribonuclease VII small subunit
MAENKIPADIRKMSFEDALVEMEDIVQRLESGEVKLDEAIDAYTRGAHLKKHCQSKLKEAQVRIDMDSEFVEP